MTEKEAKLNEDTVAAEAETVESPATEASEAASASSVIEISQEDMEHLVQGLKDLMAEKEQQQQAHLRLQADFDNFRKRTSRERDELINAANRELLLSLLPVADNFTLALAKADAGAVKDGVELIHKQFLQVLQSAGVEKMDVLGKIFDPAFHEAVMQEEAAEAEQKGKVTAEIRTGYLYKGALLRAAMVKVGI